ncbi:MAG: glycosyltransferase [Ruminococcus sp.]|nr:glycosyltransferase [Ruminococcus sp.]
MKKVVILTPSLGMGGMERVLVNYANLFAGRGFDVTVLNFTYDEPSIVSNLDKRVHYIKHYMPVHNPRNASVKDILRGNFRILSWAEWIKRKSPDFLYRKYIKEQYDIEIAFFGSEAIKILSGSPNKNAFGWIHNVNVDSYVRSLGSLEDAKAVYQRISKLVCVSQQAKEQIGKVFDRTDNVFVVNNPNDTKTIRAKAEEFTVDTHGVFTFVTVARFYDKQKGFIRLLNECKKLKDNDFEFNLWLIGDGADLEMVKNKAQELELDNVTFFGRQGNPYPYIKCADMYLSASYHEGFSMVMMEAVILGTPMLTTDVSGAREMIGDSEYGLLVENSGQGIYDGISKVLSDPSYYEHLKARAKLRMDYLSEEKLMDQLEGYFDDTFK